MGNYNLPGELSLIVRCIRSYQTYQITLEMMDLVYNDHWLGQLPIHDLMMPIMAIISTYK